MTAAAPLRLGTRRSQLALAQAESVAAQVRARTGLAVELVRVVTHGDRTQADVTQLGGTGVFVSALRDALAAGEIDLAVHSLKDMPTAPAPGLVVAAVPPREDPRDVLICPAGRRLSDLAPGTVIGTGSPRRAAQLLALGRGLRVVPVRGNVDTRLKLAIDGEVDAVVLARAGLARLDRLDAVTDVLDPEVMLPAAGQGALAVECRQGTRLPSLLRDALDDPATHAAVAAERACLARLEAGCTAPVGALARVTADRAGSAGTAGDVIHLRAVVVAPDGSSAVRRAASGPVRAAEALGERLADGMLSAGALTLMGTR